jgi:acetoin:2,6-dichlorophenolindophenol oxidoreductase subunit alpha
MTPPTTQDLTDEGRRALISTMVLIRTYEEAIRREYYADKKPAFDIGAGLVPGEMHLSAGQEPVAAGICAHLTPEDALTATHRPHHLAIAHGVALRPMTAEIFGRESGLGHGRGGHMHLFDPSTHFPAQESSPRACHRLWVRRSPSSVSAATAWRLRLPARARPTRALSTNH